MAKSGLFSVIRPAEAVRLTQGNAQAVSIWNECRGEVRWPDLLYLFVVYEVTDPELMLRRLRVLRELMGKSDGR